MENPKTRNKKESKPIPKKKNSIKSNISHPNLKKNGEKCTKAGSDNLIE